ncbi:MAG: peptidylprolyl isomerase [Planctomycetes bacterium]|nr:peptidylprolyl isomerase [Planctomycetota bacterium]
MNRFRLPLLLVCLGLLPLTITSQDSAPPEKAGSFKLKSEALSVDATVFTQGDYVGVEFRVDSPLQPDARSPELTVYVSRDRDSLIELTYAPTGTEWRRSARKRVSNAWNNESESFEGMAGEITEQQPDSWRAVVWIDPTALGGSLDDTWRMGFRVDVNLETVSWPAKPEQITQLETLTLKKLDARTSDGEHPAKRALESERRILKVFHAVSETESRADKCKLLEAAVKADPTDAALLAALVFAARRTWYGGEDVSEPIAALKLALKACTGWFGGHAMLLEEMIDDDDFEAAADYFLKWDKALPVSDNARRARFFGLGCGALAAAHRWEKLDECLLRLGEDDYGPGGLGWEVQQVAEYALGGGRDELATNLRDRLLKAGEEAGRTPDLRVWWLTALEDAGRYAMVLKEAREVKGVEGVMGDRSLRDDFTGTCVHAIGCLYDPPQAADECAKLIKDGDGVFTDDMIERIDGYAKACTEADEDWQAELTYRKEDAEKQNPRMRMKTDKGEFVIELFEDDAPNTVANFIKLAQDGFYNGRKIYRRESGWLVQGGGRDDSPTGGDEGWTIKNEDNRRQHWRGTIAMARRMDKDSADTHFFITIGNTPGAFKLATDWVVFGRIVEGLEVAQRLQVDDKITKATAENLRDHKYEPVRTPVKEEEK